MSPSGDGKPEMESALAEYRQWVAEGRRGPVSHAEARKILLGPDEPSTPWDRASEGLDECLRLVSAIREDTRAFRETLAGHATALAQQGEQLARNGELLEEILRRLPPAP